MIDFFRYNTKNAKALLNNLYFTPSMTRGQLSKKQNCTPAMISIISGKMLQDNIIKEAPTIETVVKTGPKEKSLVFNGDFALFLGIYLGKSRVSIGVSNAKNKPIESVSKRFDEKDVGGKLDFIKKTGEELIKKYGKSNFFAVGAGAVGVLDNKSSLCDTIEKNFDLKEYLERAFSLPVSLDNNVRALATAEYLSKNRTPSERFIFVKYGPGLGSAMAPISFSVQSDVYLGEIGHMKVAGSELPCSCGKKGCLEAEICEERVLLLFNEKASVKASSAYEVFELFEKGNKDAKYAVDILLDKLSLTLSHLYLIFKNVQIVLCGKLFEFDKIKEAILKKTAVYLETAGISERLLFSSQEDENRFLGGSAVAIWEQLLN